MGYFYTNKTKTGTKIKYFGEGKISSFTLTTAIYSVKPSSFFSFHNAGIKLHKKAKQHKISNKKIIFHLTTKHSQEISYKNYFQKYIFEKLTLCKRLHIFVRFLHKKCTNKLNKFPNEILEEYT